MANKVENLVKYIEKIADPNLQENWDNSGPQIIFKEEETESIIFSLDVDDKVVDLAIEKGAKLIISHHPLIFRGIKSINSDQYLSNNIIRLIKNNISVYSSHTSLDIANGGVNDTLCDLLELEECSGLSKTQKGFYIGKISKKFNYKTIEELLYKIYQKLDTRNIRFYGKWQDNLKNIAVCGGTGADLIDQVIEQGANIYITADVKYHDAQYAYENNILLIDLGHHNSEKIIIEKLEKLYKKNFDIKTYKNLETNFQIFIDEKNKR